MEKTEELREKARSKEKVREVEKLRKTGTRNLAEMKQDNVELMSRTEGERDGGPGEETKKKEETKMATERRTRRERKKDREQEKRD